MPHSVKRKKRPDRKASLRLTFNKFARKALRDFPQLKDKFSLYSKPTDSWHGKPANDDRMHAAQEDLLLEADSSDDIAFARRAEGIYLIAYVRMRRYRTMTSSKEPRLREISAILEHELGHLVAPGGYNTNRGATFSECVADAFSFLRQLQQHGDISRPLKATAWISARDLILSRETLHYTAPVLQELGKLAEGGGLNSLTPAETANLAYRLSLQHAVPEKQLRELAEVFAPVRDLWQKDPVAALRKCAETIFEDHGELSPLVHAAGKTFLTPILDRDMAILASVMPPRKAKEGLLRLEGEPWDALRAKLGQRAPRKDNAKKTARKTKCPPTS